MEEHRQQAAATAIAICKVLDHDDLLVEILVRVGFPTTLVCAALVCKRWLGHVSDGAFLRQFRELHPPRLLGVYVEDRSLPSATPIFVATLPQPPELTAVILHARFSLEDYNLPPATLRIHACRNGGVFIHWYDSEGNSLARVHMPLCPAERGMAVLPPLPRCPRKRFSVGDRRYCIIRQVLSQEDGDHGMSYFILHVEARLNSQVQFSLQVYILQDGCWLEKFHIFDTCQLPDPRSEPKSVLLDDKIYMPAGLRHILVLDLKTSSTSIIQLPRGVDNRQKGTTMLSRAKDASGLYLIQVKGFQLRSWLHKGDNSWMPVDTIYLHEMWDNLKESGCTIEYYYDPLLMSQVMDYGDLLFLKMGGCVLQLDIKCRAMRKVYETKEDCLGDINPFMMIWPPKFPALKYDPARSAT